MEFFVFLLLFLGQTDAKIISRPNVGIIFTQEQDVTINPTYWHHTVAIPLNVSLWEPYDTVCARNTTELCRTIDTVNTLYYKTSIQLQAQVSNIQSEIFQLAMAKNSLRDKRGLFDILGKGAKAVFGVATMDDVKVLAKHIAQLQTLVSDSDHNRKTDITTLHSYQVQADQRMDHLASHLESLDNALLNMSSKFDNFQLIMKDYMTYADMVARHSILFNDTFHLISWISQYNIRLSSLANTHTILQSLLHDIPHLVDGKLTPNIISPSLIRSLLSEVDNNLRSTDAKLTVACGLDYFYRNTGTVVSALHDNALFIKLNIPLTFKHSPFNLFMIDVLPVPTDETNEMYTILSDISPFLLLSSDNSSFLPLTFSQKNRLFDLAHPLNFIPKPVTQNNCIINVYFDIHDQVSKTCRLKILHKPNFPHDRVYLLPDFTYLMYTPNTKWLLKCPDRVDEVVSHSGIFTVTLQCKCFLSANAVSYTAAHTQCDDSTHTVSYSSNFLVYSSLYQSLNLQLNISKFSSEPIHFQLPASVIDSVKLHSLEKLDQSTNSEALHAFKPSSFNTDTSLYQYMNWFQSSTGSAFLSITSIILICFNVLLLTVVIVGAIKFRKMQIALATLSAVQSAKAIRFTLPTPTNMYYPPITISVPQWQTILLGLVLLCTTLVLLTLLYIWYHIPNLHSPLRRTHSQVVLSLSSDNIFLQLPLLSLPIDVLLPAQASQLPLLKISFSFSLLGPYAKLHWISRTLPAVHGFVSLPSKVRISFPQAFRLCRLLTQPHLCHIHYVTVSQIHLLTQLQASPPSPYHLLSSAPHDSSPPSSPTAPSPLYPKLNDTSSAPPSDSPPAVLSVVMS